MIESVGPEISVSKHRRVGGYSFQLYGVLRNCCDKRKDLKNKWEITEIMEKTERNKTTLNSLAWEIYYVKDDKLEKHEKGKGKRSCLCLMYFSLSEWAIIPT